MSKNEERILKIEESMRKLEAEPKWDMYDHEIYDYFKNELRSLIKNK